MSVHQRLLWFLLGGLIVGAVILVWLLSSVYIVRIDQQAVVTRFGARPR